MIAQDPETTIKTSVIHPDKYGLFITLYLIGGLFITMGIAWVLHLFSVALIGAFLIFLTPVVFQDRFRKAFCETALMHFYSDRLVVELLDQKTGTLHKRQECRFNEMASYTEMKSSKDDSTYIKIKFLGRSALKYTIPGKNKEAGGNELTSVLASYIHAYNQQQDSGHQIKFIPPLLASRTAVYYLAGLIALLVFGIVWQLIYRPHTIFLYALIPAALFFILILFQRKKDLEISRDNK